MTSRIKLTLLAVVVIALLFLGLRMVGGRAAEPAAPAAAASAAAPAALELMPDDVVSARLQRLSRQVEVSGSIKAVQAAFIKARVPGELRQLSVREGDAVRAGQVLGQIDTTEYDWRLKQEIGRASCRERV